MGKKTGFVSHLTTQHERAQYEHHGPQFVTNGYNWKHAVRLETSLLRFVDEDSYSPDAIGQEDVIPPSCY
jgi:hypothetical protein